MIDELRNEEMMLETETLLKASYDRSEKVLGEISDTPDKTFKLEPDSKLLGGYCDVLIDAAWYIRMGDDKWGDWAIWRDLAEEVKKLVESKPETRLLLGYFYLKENKVIESDFLKNGLRLSEPNPENIEWALKSFEDYFSKENLYLDHSGALMLCADIFSVCFANADISGSVTFSDEYIPDGSYLTVAQLKKMKTYVDGYIQKKRNQRGDIEFSEKIQMGIIESQFSSLRNNQQKTDLVQDQVGS